MLRFELEFEHEFEYEFDFKPEFERAVCSLLLLVFFVVVKVAVSRESFSSESVSSPAG